MAKFCDRVKELRQEKGLTQKELAETLDLKLRTYRTYEYEESYPSVPGLLALADFFDVSLDYLVGRSEVRERR